MTSRPFAELGLDDDASAEDVRDARRRLAKDHHPDRGGDPERMRSINVAAAKALRAIDARSPDALEPDANAGPSAGPEFPNEPSWSGLSSDTPSFTVEALPVETFEALLIVASWLGEVLDDDPPYRLEVQLVEPFVGWCGLEVVPDAGGSTVSLAVASTDEGRLPDVIAVRDAWIDGLNRLDWS